MRRPTVWAEIEPITVRLRNNRTLPIYGAHLWLDEARQDSSSRPQGDRGRSAASQMCAQRLITPPLFAVDDVRLKHCRVLEIWFDCAKTTSIKPWCIEYICTNHLFALDIAHLLLLHLWIISRIYVIISSHILDWYWIKVWLNYQEVFFAWTEGWYKFIIIELYTCYEDDIVIHWIYS